MDDAETEALNAVLSGAKSVKVYVIDKTETGRSGFKKTLVLDFKNAHAFFKGLRSKGEEITGISQTWNQGIIIRIRTITDEDETKEYTLKQVGTDLERV